MRIITEFEAKEVSGGFLQVLAAIVAVFVAPKIFNDHRKEYNEWGHNLGETVWEWQHPYDPNNPTGVYK